MAVTPKTSQLDRLRIEVPSWAYGNSGTRFKVFGSPACRATRSRRSPTRPRCTGYTASRPASRSTSRGTRSTTSTRCAGTPRTSASRSARSTRTPSRTTTSSSAASPTPTRDPPQGDRPPLRVHRGHGRDGSRDLKIWLADGTNYPGQDDIREPPGPPRRVARADLRRDRRRARMVLEYKFFEPAFYHTDVPDWGTSYVHCVALGDRAKVCSTPATTRPAPTSSSSSPSCCGSGGSAPSTSTHASTPTTT